MKIPEKEFTPAPSGLQHAVLADAIDCGMVDDRFAGEPRLKYKLVWLLAETMEDGKPYMVSRTYSASLHPQSSLRADLLSWRGRDFANAQERRDFDLDSMIGVGATLNIIHNEGEHGIFANVAAVMPLPKGIPVPAIPADYVRHKDRPEARFNGKFTKHGNGSRFGAPLPATTANDREVPF